MNPSIIQLPSIRVAMVRHRGPYEGVGAVFDELWEWVTANAVPAQRTIGIYWDNPDHTLRWLLRSAACVEIPIGYQIPDGGKLRVEDSQIAAGTYVTTTFTGPYEDLAPVWTDLTSRIEGSLGRQIRSDPAFEVYVNDVSCTPPSQLITELYMPVY